MNSLNLQDIGVLTLQYMYFKNYTHSNTENNMKGICHNIVMILYLVSCNIYFRLFETKYMYCRISH